jgi:hypothetical protein
MFGFGKQLERHGSLKCWHYIKVQRKRLGNFFAQAKIPASTDRPQNFLRSK